jgi:hypothetical protein
MTQTKLLTCVGEGAQKPMHYHQVHTNLLLQEPPLKGQWQINNEFVSMPGRAPTISPFFGSKLLCSSSFTIEPEMNIKYKKKIPIWYGQLIEYLLG